MTVIKQLELTAFGKFSGVTITLENGINKFIHENEWGKSTLCDFILFMLYGIKAVNRKTATLDEKQLEKYLPWSDPSRIAGAMEIEHEGALYRIERSVTAKGSGKLKVYKNAFECDIKEPGISFFGVDKETFIRTFLVRQTDIRFERTEDIESALTNLVTTGDEDVSYEGAIKKLDDLQRPIQSQKQSNTGKIPLIRREIMALEDSLGILGFKKQTLDGKLSELSELSASLDGAKKQLDALLQKEAVARANDARNVVCRLDALDKSIAEYKQKMADEQRALTDTEKTYIADTFDSYAQTNIMVNADRQKYLELQSEMSQEKSSFPDYDIFDKNEGEITALVDKKPTPSIPLLIIGVILALVGIFAGIFVMPALFVFCGVGVLFATLGFTVVKTAVKIPPQYAVSQNELCSKLSRFYSLRERLVRIMLECEMYKKRINDGEKSLSELLAAIETIKSDYGIDSKPALENRIVLQNTAGETKAALNQMYAQRAMLLANADEAQLRDMAKNADDSGITLSALTDKKVALTSKINELSSSLSVLESARIAREDVLREIYESEQKLCDNKKQLEELEYKNDVYSYVRRALDLANEKINNTYSPILSKKLAPVLSEITGTKYSDVTVDKEFNIRVKADGEYHALGYFSRGTADAVYLAVRLCMADILCESAPLILDDPFWSFDGQRLENAMKTIEKISENRQIILFGAR